jgi:peptide/nickel transport system substrate-binding protein
MKLRYKAVLSSIVMSLVPLGLAGCGTPSTQIYSGSTTKPITVGISTDVLSLDPYVTTDTISEAVQSLLYNSLAKLSKSGIPQPSLATWVANPTGTSYTFTIAHGMKFSNGRPIQAADVAASFKYMLSPTTHSPWSSYFSEIKSVQTLGTTRVTVHLKNPYAPFLSTVASFLPILPATFLKSEGPTLRTEISSGPYVISKWIPNQKLVLSQNPYYKGAHRPKAKQVIFDVIPSSTSRIAALASNKIQFMLTLNPSTNVAMQQFAASKRINVQTHLSPLIHKLGLNVKFKPFSNPLVREALSYAINRKTVLQRAALGQGQVSGPISSVLPYWTLPPSQFASYRTSDSKARALLKQAGYPHGFSFSVIAPNILPVDVSSAEVIKSQLSKVGVTMNIQQLSWGVYIHDWVTRNMNAWVGEGSEFSDPDLILYGAFYTGQPINASSYSNHTVDALLTQGRQSTNPTTRKTIYDTLQKLLVKQSPVIFTFASDEYIATAPSLHGYQFNPYSPYRGLIESWNSKK